MDKNHPFYGLMKDGLLRLGAIYPKAKLIQVCIDMTLADVCGDGASPPLTYAMLTQKASG